MPSACTLQVEIGGTLHEVEMFQLRPDQKEIADSPARFKIINCGRRYGKSTLVAYMALCCFFSGGSVAWVVPDYKNARAPWKLMLKVLAPLIRKKVVVHHKNDKTISIPGTDAFIALYTKKNIDSVVGQPFHLLVVDEAAQFTKEEIEVNLRPCLSDVYGDMVMPSTPRGKNYYYEYYMRGQQELAHGVPNPQYDREYQSWMRPSEMNPNPFIRKEVEMAARTVNKITYLQEYKAEFLNEGGEVFGNITACIKGNEPVYEPEPFANYLLVADPGRSTDPLEIGIFDIRQRRLVHLERHENMPHPQQYNRLEELISYWRPIKTVIEVNRGRETIEQLRLRGHIVDEFLMDRETKQQAVDKLAAAMEHGSIRLLDDPVLKHQLEIYQSLRSRRTGLFSYTAPDGEHDDAVVVCMIGLMAIDQMSGSQLYSVTDCQQIPLPLSTGTLVGFASFSSASAAVAIMGVYRGHLHLYDLIDATVDSSSITSAIEKYPLVAFGLDRSNHILFYSGWNEWVARRMSVVGEKVPELRLVSRSNDVAARVISQTQGVLANRNLTIEPEVSNSRIWRDLLNPESLSSDAIAGALELLKAYGHLAAA